MEVADLNKCSLTLLPLALTPRWGQSGFGLARAVRLMKQCRYTASLLMGAFTNSMQLLCF